MIYDLLEPTEQIRLTARLQILKKKGALVDLTEKTKKRTVTQNSAIHKYCEMIAEVLNDMGHTFEFKGLKKMQIEIPYSAILVKETIWKPIQMALFDKSSTTELTTSEVSKVAEPIEMMFAKMDIVLPFPSKD